MTDLKNEDAVDNTGALTTKAGKPVKSMHQLEKVSEGISRYDSFKVDPRLIQPQAGFNLRGGGVLSHWDDPKTIEKIEILCAAYTENPLLVTPISVKFDDTTGKIFIRDGEHRWRGVMLAIERGANIEKIHVLNFSGDESDEMLLMLQSANSTPLNPVERALGYHKLFSYGMSVDEIAKKTMKSVSHIKQMLQVYELPIETKRKIASGRLKVNAALSDDREEKVKKEKTKVPTKKVVVELSDILNEFKNAEVIDGKVSVQIPYELFEKFLKEDALNGPSETDDSDENGEFQFE